jgi:hypothetical protein
MREDEVPQDRAKAFEGRAKALYALDCDGRYTLVRSSGWEAEEIVLDQALVEYERSAAEALERVRAGKSSPLEVHMFRRRMDVLLLAQSTGFFRWQVRRHLKPAPFARLSPAKRARYAEALGLEVEGLGRLPEGPPWTS